MPLHDFSSRFFELPADLYELSSAPVDASFHQKGIAMTWDQLIQDIQFRGWHVYKYDQWIDIEATGDVDHLAIFRRDEQGLAEAQQFLQNVRHGQGETANSVSTRLEQMNMLIKHEREAGPSNDLTTFFRCQRRRAALHRQWERIQTELAQVKQAISDLPALPVAEEIRWAQTVLAMNDLAFLEIDTTGLRHEDEMTRFTLLGSGGQEIADILIKPSSRQLSSEASIASGIQSAQLEKGAPIELAWGQIQDALAGRYVISFGLEWDLQQLQHSSERHQLEPVLVIGDCLQRHATRYYNGEYYLKLEELCARAGSPLPAKPHQTSLDRAHGQRAALQALAQAVTDLRRSKAETPAVEMPGYARETAGDDYDPFLDADDLP